MYWASSFLHLHLTGGSWGSRFCYLGPMFLTELKQQQYWETQRALCRSRQTVKLDWPHHAPLQKTGWIESTLLLLGCHNFLQAWGFNRPKGNNYCYNKARLPFHLRTRCLWSKQSFISNVGKCVASLCFAMLLDLASSKSRIPNTKASKLWKVIANGTRVVIEYWLLSHYWGWGSKMLL